MRVMIVEDQVMIRGLLETYFTKENGDQIVASIPGAGQAVELCRTRQVDLILMDVQTQHRENGLTAVREIKARYPKIRIIIVTSLVDGAVLDEAKAAGADSLWYKDHGQEEIMEVIDRTLEGFHKGTADGMYPSDHGGRACVSGCTSGRPGGACGQYGVYENGAEGFKVSCAWNVLYPYCSRAWM